MLTQHLSNTRTMISWFGGLLGQTPHKASLSFKLGFLISPLHDRHQFSESSLVRHTRLYVHHKKD